MSLNAGIDIPNSEEFTLDNLGLTKDKVNEDGVLGGSSATSPVAVLHTDMSTPGPHNTSLSDEEISSLPLWENKIVILKQTADKIVDMKEVQKDIETSGAMSKSTGDVVEATFESYYSPSHHRNSYTPFDSHVNLNYAKKFMDDKIKVSMEALLTTFREIKDDGIPDITKALEATQGYCDKELRATVEDTVNKVQAVTEQLLAGPVMLPFEGPQFVDMCSANLLEIDLDKLVSDVSVPDDFRQALETVKTLWTTSSGLRESVSQFQQKYLDNNPGLQGPSVLDGLFVATILCVFGIHTSDAVYNHFVHESGISGINEAIEKSVAAIDGEIDRGQDTASVISNQANAIANLTSTAGKVNMRIKAFSDFTKACGVLVVGLVSLR